MSVIEKYQKIIAKIEECCQDKFKTMEEIPDLVADHMIMPSRTLADVFKFITDMTLIKYIRERKMMHAYLYLCEEGDSKIIDAVEISPYDNQSSFTTNFKKMFQMTPKEAQKNKNKELYRGPMTWEVLLEMKPEKAEIKYSEIEKVQEASLMFGIPQDQFENFRKIDNLRALYGFSDYLADRAYHFSQEHDYPLKKSFDYFNEYIKYGTDEYNEFYEGQFKDERDYYENEMRRDIEDPERMYLFLEKGQTDLYWEIIERAHNNGIKDVRTLTDTAIVCIACLDMEAGTCMHTFYALKAAAYYDEHGGDCDEESIIKYMDEVFECPTIEEAFEAYREDAAFDDWVSGLGSGRYYDDDFRLSDIDKYEFDVDRSNWR